MKTKEPTIKTKKTGLIIYKDGYLCVNGNYIIKADLVQVDDTLMQDKINNNIPFYYQTYIKNYSEQIPDLLSIIPKYSASSYYLKETNLLQKSFNTNETFEAFYNDDLGKFIFFDADYIKIFRDTNLSLLLRQAEPTAAATIYNDNLECLFVVMPCLMKSSFLHQIEHYLKPIKGVA